jgi:hypothetical protein
MRVVVAHVQTGVALGHTEVREQEGNRLGGHRGAAIGVDGELVALNTLLGMPVLHAPASSRRRSG